MTAYNYALNESKGLQNAVSYLTNRTIAVGPEHIPSWMVRYLLPGHYVVDTNLVINGKRYTVSYIETAIEVPKKIPIMQTMLDSFRAIK